MTIEQIELLLEIIEVKAQQIINPNFDKQATRNRMAELKEALRATAEEDDGK